MISWYKDWSVVLTSVKITLKIYWTTARMQKMLWCPLFVSYHPYNFHDYQGAALSIRPDTCGNYLVSDWPLLNHQVF